MQIKIPEDVVKKLERYDYEVQSRQQVIENILLNNYEINNELFNHYQLDYDNKVYLFMKEKLNFEQEYVIPNLPQDYINNYNWKLNYKTLILTINKN